MNYFELFDLPARPVVDRAQLQKKYFELQRKFHPDFYSDATETEKDDTLQQSAAVNKAYHIFQDAEKTIEYYLRERGVLATDEKYELPPAFLMEMMELNEALAEEGKERVAEQVQEMEHELHAEIEPVLAPEADLDGIALEKLKAYYFKKKYLQRILDRFDD